MREACDPFLEIGFSLSSSDRRSGAVVVVERLKDRLVYIRGRVRCVKGHTRS